MIPEVERAVTPGDCTLLISAPLDREQFFADLERNDKEFARNFQSERPNFTDEALWRRYEPYAGMAKEVGRRARELGVRVVENASLADFQREICANQVITLFAHWRSARFREADIADSAGVQAYLQKKGWKEEAGCAEWEELNAILDSIAGDDEDHVEGSAGYRVARQYAWHAARSGMEAELGDSIRGGAAVEFAEGFQLISEVLRTIPPTYSGTLDLTVCQSVMLGEEVKRECRHCLVLASASDTTMAYRFALYRQVIEVLATKPQPFVACAVSIRKELIRKYGKKKR